MRQSSFPRDGNVGQRKHCPRCPVSVSRFEPVRPTLGPGGHTRPSVGTPGMPSATLLASRSQHVPYSRSGEFFMNQHSGALLGVRFGGPGRERGAVGRGEGPCVDMCDSHAALRCPLDCCDDGVRAVVGTTGCLRGRPRGRFLSTITPFSKISPPQTPHGSRRASAPARHDALTGQSPHRYFARSSSAGASANHRSASPERHGRAASGEATESSSSATPVVSIRSPVSAFPDVKAGADGIRVLLHVVVRYLVQPTSGPKQHEGRGSDERFRGLREPALLTLRSGDALLWAQRNPELLRKVGGHTTRRRVDSLDVANSGEGDDPTVERHTGPLTLLHIPPRGTGSRLTDDPTDLGQRRASDVVLPVELHLRHLLSLSGDPPLERAAEVADLHSVLAGYCPVTGTATYFSENSPLPR
ncbi:hypothetical protein MINT15_09090 [Saccharomonospora viridis]|uniref:Uncharacterized protein n=1 Tax=Saccharomonospora viridis TaxID=1852 RepID=A0A837DEF2_9PSEU|nr:hypothetical protein MINT15_09090 [Saccharomonospora viridis]